jgi:hypothetical protein
MTKRFLLSSLVLGVGIGGASGAQEPADSVKGMTATVQGCVLDGKDGSYVLTHVVETSGLGGPATDPTLKNMSGMHGGGDGFIYWLSSDSAKHIKEHVGRRVEVTGVVTSESRGTVRVKQAPGKSGRDNKVEVEARGKDAIGDTEKPVKAETTFPVKSDKTQGLPVRRVKVDSVKVIAPTCP